MESCEARFFALPSRLQAGTAASAAASPADVAACASDRQRAPSLVPPMPSTDLFDGVDDAALLAIDLDQA